MDESALRNRLETIERRQFFVITLLVGIYLLGGLWFLVRETAVLTVWNVGVGGVVLGVFASIVGIYRRRRAR